MSLTDIALSATGLLDGAIVDLRCPNQIYPIRPAAKLQLICANHAQINPGGK
jgi:hypothetical protein